jgi:Fe-S-cluster containining protein
MKIIKIRTVEEAKRLRLPEIPMEFYELARTLFNQSSIGRGRHSVLRDMYDLVDRVGRLVDPFTVCREGCAACCHIPVFITEVEATYIERNEKNQVARGVRSSRTRHSGACTLLSSDGRCTVYKSRPLVCRIYAAFDDPVLCENKDIEHITYGPASNQLFRGCCSWLSQLNKHGAIADIREFFPNQLLKK